MVPLCCTVILLPTVTVVDAFVLHCYIYCSLLYTVTVVDAFVLHLVACDGG